MRLVADLEVPVSAAGVWPHVESLDRYPAWMRLVHRVEPVDALPHTWDVELRARVGPFTRSKRLRMERTEYVPHERVRFERVGVDGRDHAEWTLTTTLAGVEDGTRVQAELFYGGELWAGDGILRRVLDDEIRRAKTALVSLLDERSPTP